MKIEQVEIGTPGYAAFQDAGLGVEEHPAIRAWVAQDTQRLLDPRVNPYWKQAERGLFVASRDGQPVGRVAAIHDRVVQAQHRSREGFFGFFACIDDVAVARALLQAAQQWLARLGCDRLHGPFSPLPDFDGFGILVDGFDEPRVSGEAWNPDFYDALLMRCGLEKESDFLAFQSVFAGNPELERAMARFERILARHHSTRVRGFDIAQFERDEELVREILNRGFEGQPLYSELGAETQAFLLHTIARPEDMHWFQIAEHNGQPAGVNLLAPNDLGAPGDGSPRGLRTSEFCILPEFQHTDVAAALMVASWKKAMASEFEWASASYQDEADHAMHQMLELFGCRRYKRFRLYRCGIGSGER